MGSPFVVQMEFYGECTLAYLLIRQIILKSELLADLTLFLCLTDLITGFSYQLSEIGHSVLAPGASYLREILTRWGKLEICIIGYRKLVRISGTQSGEPVTSSIG